MAYQHSADFVCLPVKLLSGYSSQRYNRRMAMTRWMIKDQMRSMLNLVLFSIGSTIAFEIQVSNNCHEPLWPAITGTNFSVHDKLFAKGLRLDYGNSTSIQLHPTPKWSGRIWARSRCDHSGAFCALGNCNNQTSCWNSSASDTTLVELTLDKDILDYDISLGKSPRTTFGPWTDALK